MKTTLPWLALIACAADPLEGPLDDTAAPVTLADDPLLGADALVPHLQALQDIADAHAGNRAMGTSGYDASVDYVVTTLEALGLEPRLEAFDASSWQVDGGAVRWAEQTLPDADLGALEWAPGGTVTAEVVSVDPTLPPGAPNTSTSGCEAEDFDAFPQGAIALLQRGSCTFATKIALAEAAGASAVLVFNEGQPGRQDAVQGTLDQDAPPGIPALGLSYDAGLALAEVEGPVTVELEARTVTVTSHNVLVDVTGASDTLWVVGAHLDSVPEGPGINDNGSGVATLLQLAARTAAAPLPHTVRFAFWGGEEAGLLGSLAHVRSLTDDDLADTLGYFNYDMVGSPNPARFVYDADGSAFPLPEGLPLVPAGATMEATLLGHFADRELPTDPTPYDGRSDYLGFALVGLPTGGTFTGAEAIKPPAFVAKYGGTAGQAFDACYHLACDTFDNVDTAILVEMAAAAAHALETVASAPEGPARRRLPLRLDPASVPSRADHGCHGGEHVDVR